MHGKFPNNLKENAVKILNGIRILFEQMAKGEEERIVVHAKVFDKEEEMWFQGSFLERDVLVEKLAELINLGASEFGDTNPALRSVIDQGSKQLIDACKKHVDESEPEKKIRMAVEPTFFNLLSSVRIEEMEDIKTANEIPRWVQDILVANLLVAMEDEVLLCRSGKPAKLHSLVTIVTTQNMAIQSKSLRNEFFIKLEILSLIEDTEFGDSFLGDRIYAWRKFKDRK